LISVSLVSCSSLSCSVIFSNCCLAALICFDRIGTNLQVATDVTHENPSNCTGSHTAESEVTA
jgi:hypothetical protein